MKTLNNIISKNILKNSLNELYKNGLPNGLNSGLKNLDDIFRLDRGKLICITGIPNMGKSEMLDFLCVQYNKKHGLKTLYFSPENQPIALHMSKLVSKYTNTDFSNKLIDEEVFNNTVDYITDNFFFLNYDSVFTLDSVLKEAENLINSEHIEILVIDSYNKLEAQKDFNVNELDYISKVLDTLERFAKKHNILVFIVAHPKKMQKDASGNYLIPSAYDINGSANFFNKPDYCITVHRDYLNDNVIIKVDKVKFKNYGSVGETRLGYDIASGNYFDIDVNELDLDTYEPVKQYTPYNFTIPELKNITKINYLDTEINKFNNITDLKPSTCTLNDVLFTDMYSGAKKMVDAVRFETDSNKRKELKKQLPNYTVSCTFNGVRNGTNIKNINNLIVLDIDKKDNLNIIEKVPSILKSLDNVLYYSKSCSGEGFFCIVPIKYPQKFAEHWQSLKTDFQLMGINIDESCKDVTRVRYFSYDDNKYYNENATVYDRLESVKKESNTTNQRDKKNPLKELKQGITTDFENDIEYKKLIKLHDDCLTNKINIAESHANWYTIAMGLINEFGKDGKKLFNLFSSLSKKYNKDETDEFYEGLLNNYEENSEITINSIFYLYNEIKKK